jgi:hydrogenase maturation factor
MRSLYAIARIHNVSGDLSFLSSQFRGKTYWLELDNYNFASFGQIAVTTNREQAQEWLNELNAIPTPCEQYLYEIQEFTIA